MEASKLKNMVVIKNLPSNIVDEAIIVLKTSKKIKKLQKIEQNRKISVNDSTKKDKDYIVKEAEMLVNDYISRIENNDKKDIFDKNLKEKYRKSKRYSIVITIACIIQAMLIVL